MSVDLLPGSILSMSAQAAERLLRLDSGDAALLYLYLLGHPDPQGLKWPALRIQTAMDQLVSQGLARPQTAPVVPDPTPEPPPDYAIDDINSALQGGTFSGLCDEVERRLGKKLSTSDLKSMLTLYDHLALPIEVILMLVAWCVEEQERKYGAGRRPFVSQIRKEGFIWARRGIDTIEAAEAHIQKLTALQGREKEMLRLLDIPNRPLVSREKSYIAAWDEMGFEDEAIRMAYEKTVMKKQSMDWTYMNGILRRWHEKGLHTAASILTGDRDPRPMRAAGTTTTVSPQEDRSAREDMERMRRMLEQMKKEE